MQTGSISIFGRREPSLNGCVVDSAVMKPGLLEDQLRTDLERNGYYPQLIFEAVAAILGDESLHAYVVQHETAFDRDELRRHLTVLALTESRLIVEHTDEHNVDGIPHASTSTEAVRLDKVDSVVLTRVVRDPAGTMAPMTTSEVVLTIGWGAVSRIDLEVARCGDPSCDADHGFTGSSSNDDFSMRASEAADGADVVEQVLDFASKLSQATARHSTSR